MDLESVRHVLHAIATTLVPEVAALDAHAWAEVEGVIVGALSARPARMQRQFITFLRLLQALPIVRYGRPFTGLSESQRASVLKSVERSRLLIVRRGFWGLRTLVFMGYYTRDDVAESIGYHPHAEGWAARDEAVATVPLAPTLWVEP